MSYNIEAIVEDVVSEMVQNGKLFPNFEFRTGQKEVIVNVLDEFLNHKVPTVILDAPTGTGKSVIARIIAEVCNMFYSKDTLFLTSTITLQNQYIREFKDVVKLMGARNYSCHDEGGNKIPRTKKRHPTCRYAANDSGNVCAYDIARNKFNASLLKILNYKFYLTAFGKYNAGGLLVCDEAHNLPDLFIELSTTKLQFDKLKDIVPEIELTDFVDMAYVQSYNNDDQFDLDILIELVQYLDKCIQKLTVLVQQARQAAENFAGSDEALVHLIESRLDPLEDKLSMTMGLYKGLCTLFSSGDINEWLIYKEDVDEDPLTVSIKPFTVRDNSLFFFSAPTHRLLMTATPFELARDLKLPEDTFKVINMDYMWPLENRPIVISDELPSMNYRNKQEVFPLYMETLDEFLDAVGNVRGIIHSSSYENAHRIVKESKHRARMIVPETVDVRRLNEIMAGKENIIAVSPAILTGVDLPGDLCTFQVVFKVPYPSLGDPYVASKKDIVDGWYEEIVAKQFIQGVGRAVRSKDDYAVTLCLDKSIRRVIGMLGESVPKWFKDTIQ